jgi:hypothetical protein
MGTELRRLKPETITRALLALRAELIREGGDGLEHVEALLQLRGSNLPPVPRKATVHFRRGKLRTAIYAALRGGPLAGPQIVERVCAAHGLAYSAMYRSVYAQLNCIKKAGMVGLDNGAWYLTPD